VQRGVAWAVLALRPRSATEKIKTAMALWTTKRRAPKALGARSVNARLGARKVSSNVARIVCVLMGCACKQNVFAPPAIQGSVVTLSEVVWIAA